MPGVNRENSQAYMMVGNQMIYEPTYINKLDDKFKRNYRANSIFVDLHPGIPVRSARRYKQLSIKKDTPIYITENSKVKDLVKQNKTVYGCIDSSWIRSQSLQGSVSNRIGSKILPNFNFTHSGKPQINLTARQGEMKLRDAYEEKTWRRAKKAPRIKLELGKILGDYSFIV